MSRYGGEEFAVILTDTDSSGAMHVDELFRAAIADLAIPHAHSAVAPCVTISVGIATAAPGHQATQHMLFEAADAMLYKAKKDGRNRVICPQL